MKVTIELTGEQVTDLLAQLGVADPVHSRASGQESGGSIGLLTAAEVAKRLGVSRENVYDHAVELGGEKLGGGPRAPWRFDASALKRPEVSAPAPKPPTRRRRNQPNVPLLEVRGDSPYAG
jgi:hypothetical protein